MRFAIALILQYSKKILLSFINLIRFADLSGFLPEKWVWIHHLLHVECWSIIYLLEVSEGASTITNSPKTQATFRMSSHWLLGLTMVYIVPVDTLLYRMHQKTPLYEKLNKLLKRRFFGAPGICFPLRLISMYTLGNKQWLYGHVLYFVALSAT